MHTLMWGTLPPCGFHFSRPPDSLALIKGTIGASAADLSQKFLPNLIRLTGRRILRFGLILTGLMAMAGGSISAYLTWRASTHNPPAGGH